MHRGSSGESAFLRLLHAFPSPTALGTIQGYNKRKYFASARVKNDLFRVRYALNPTLNSLE